jgi:mannan endo-1,4-beta-mannosidase
MNFARLSLAILFLSVFFPAFPRAADIHFLIMPAEVIGPISPYIYGLNDQDPGDLNVTVRRLGGNRLTGYNWVTNASNAGNDWHQESDDWLCADHLKDTDCDQPGAAVRHFVDQNQSLGMASLITLPMAGFVAADKAGDVTEAQTAPSDRWVAVQPRKNFPFTLSPNPKSQTVYEDEFVNFLVTNFHPASQGGVRFYDLDNEPALWPATHPRLHPAKPTYKEMVEKTEALASAVLKVDPSALILGPVMYGWQEFLTLQDAPDSADLNKTYTTYVDYYLDQMRELEKRHGQRLLHVLDLHWYPEAVGDGKRITLGDISPESVDARLQAPRSLWDPGYVEKSWITQYSTQGQPIQLIPWLKAKIDRRYPGTKLSFSEYDYGAGDHVSGGLAQADVLGIFGKYEIFLASYWGDLKPYNQAAFKLYRNYDGQKSAFGDTAVSAGSEDVIHSSVYAAVDSKSPDKLWIVVLNKNQKDSIHGRFQIEGTRLYESYQAYGFDGKSPDLKPIRRDKLHQNQFDLDLPALSATVFVCQAAGTTPAFSP